MRFPSISLKCFLLSALLLAATGFAVALAIIYSGVFDVAASRPHYALEQLVFPRTRWHSINSRANEIEVPGDLDDPARIRNGARLYDAMCAVCHLHPGAEETALHRGLNPPPPLLDEWSESAAYTFLAIKRGVRLTGMPAWGPSHDDNELWDIVAFQNQLPDLSAAEYAAMLQEAGEQPPGSARQRDDRDDHGH